ATWLRGRGPALSATTGLPERIGRYRIERLLGKGGMGCVYLAHDTLIDRPVALKVPHLGLADNPALLERFYREARSAGRLQHPHICPVYDVNESDGVHHLCMAYIEGKPLSAQTGDFARRSPREAAALVRTIALALEEAHRQGVIHRDLKPANIMINRRGEPVVMDFGLAREVRTGPTEQSHEGTILGTPTYMPPEQARGDVAAMGPGSDIYSLGVILYELLTGEIPFKGAALEVMAMRLRDDPPPPSKLRSDIDPHLEAVCLKALAKEPCRRFLSMAEFAQALDDYLQGAPPTCPLTTAEDPLAEVVAEVLVELRTWGWEVGIFRLRPRSSPEDEKDPRRTLLLRWLAGEAEQEEALAEFRGVRQLPALIGWALVGQAYTCNRRHDFARVEALLREASTRGDPGDHILQ